MEKCSVHLRTWKTKETMWNIAVRHQHDFLGVEKGPAAEAVSRSYVPFPSDVCIYSVFLIMSLSKAAVTEALACRKTVSSGNLESLPPRSSGQSADQELLSRLHMLGKSITNEHALFNRMFHMPWPLNVCDSQYMAELLSHVRALIRGRSCVLRLTKQAGITLILARGHVVEVLCL
jgi:hypothetical protein